MCPRITAFFCCFRRFIFAASSAFKRNSKSGTVSARISLIFWYIPLVVVSVIIFCLLLTRFYLRRFFQLLGFLRYPFKTHIKDSRRVCERANRDVVDTSLGDRPDILQSDVSGGFQLCLAGI